MTQEQLNTVVKILRNGAPALADELINAVVNLIQVNAKMSVELEELKSKTCDCEKEDK